MADAKKQAKSSPGISAAPPPQNAEEENVVLAPLAPLSFSVLVNAQSLRDKNGLRHSDYHRYRGFCSRKLFRLRSSLNFKCGRNRYTPKPFPHEFTDTRYLMILLVSAERAWSFAMQLKADSAAAQTFNPRARRHSIRKFAKAAKFAKMLEEICVENCDKKTIIDAQGYSDWLSGVLHMEKEDWRRAADCLKSSHQNFLQLKRISLNVPEEHIVFSNQLEETEAGVRLCRYHLERSGVDCSELLELGQNMDIDPRNPDTLMAVAAEGGEGVLTYKGVKVQPPSEKIERTLRGLVTLMESRCVKIASEDENKKNKTNEKKKKNVVEEKNKEEWWNFCKDIPSNTIIERYGEVSSLLNELLKAIHSEIIQSESAGDKPAWSLTEGYALDLLNCVDMERNALLEILFLQKLKNASEGSLWRVRYDEGVRYVDLLKQSVKNLLDGKMVSEDVEVLMLQILEILQMARAVCLSFYNASVHKYAEAFALAQWVISLGESELPVNSLDPSDPYRRIAAIFLILQEAVIFHANRQKCSCLASAVNAERDKIEEKNLGTNAILTIEDSIAKSGKFPPKLQPIPCKPLLIDLAIFDLQEPDLTARIPQTRTGFMGRLKSIWKNF